MSTVDRNLDLFAQSFDPCSNDEVYPLDDFCHLEAPVHGGKEAPRPSLAIGSRRGAAEAARVRRENFERIVVALADAQMHTGDVAQLLGVTAASARKYVFTLREVGVIAPCDGPECSAGAIKHYYQLALPLCTARERLSRIGTVAAQRMHREEAGTRNQGGLSRGTGLDSLGTSMFGQTAVGQRLYLGGSAVPRRRKQIKRVMHRDPLVAALFGPGSTG